MGISLYIDESKEPSAVHLVEQLTSVFPAFDDHREVRGEKVFFLKRAQLAVASLHRRFKVRKLTRRSCDWEWYTCSKSRRVPIVMFIL